MGNKKQQPQRFSMGIRDKIVENFLYGCKSITLCPVVSDIIPKTRSLMNKGL